MPRRVLNIDGDTTSVWSEGKFANEAELEEAVAAHPEMLPSEDLRLGPLIPLGRQLDFGSGPVDLLTTDPLGRLVIVEFKRGSDNPDVRKVVAQMLDYGSALWRTSYDDFAQICHGSDLDAQMSFEELVAERCGVIDEEFDEAAFRSGVEANLESGDFAFFYVVPDLDQRTRRIMTYLAEGARMSFLGVEVDYYLTDTNEAAVIVPRTAFVPSWVSGPSERRSSAPLPAEGPVAEMMERMDEFARDLGLQVVSAKTGRNYRPRGEVLDESEHAGGVGVYTSNRGTEFNLAIFRGRGEDDVANDLMSRIAGIAGRRVAALWPAVPCEALLEDWPRTRREVLEPYFQARNNLTKGG